MNREELINSISKRFGISQIEASDFLNSLTDVLQRSFRKGKNVNITGFGKFKVFTKHIADGRRGKFVSFSPVKKLSDEVNSDFNNLATTTVALLNDNSRSGFKFTEEIDPENDVELIFDDSQVMESGAEEITETVFDFKTNEAALYENEQTTVEPVNTSDNTDEKLIEVNNERTELFLPDDLKTLHEEIDEKISTTEVSTATENDEVITYNDVFEEKSETTSGVNKTTNPTPNFSNRIISQDEDESSRVLSFPFIILIVVIIILGILTYAVYKYNLLGNSENQVTEFVEDTETVAAEENTFELREPAGEELIAYNNAGVVLVKASDGIYIQMGSFRQRSTANKMADEINISGYEVFVIESDLGDKGIFHRVRIGKFDDIESAKEFADKKLR